MKIFEINTAYVKRLRTCSFIFAKLKHNTNANEQKCFNKI